MKYQNNCKDRTEIPNTKTITETEQKYQIAKAEEFKIKF